MPQLGLLQFWYCSFFEFHVHYNEVLSSIATQENIEYDNIKIKMFVILYKCLASYLSLCIQLSF